MSRRPILTPEEKRNKKRQADQLTNRILAVFVLAVLAIFILNYLQNMYNSMSLSGAAYYTLIVLAVLGGAALAAGIVLIVLRLCSGSRPCGLSLWLLLSGFIVGVSAALILKFGNPGFKYASVFCPVVCAYILIFFIYRFNFFADAVVAGLGFFLLWGYSRVLDNSYWDNRCLLILIIALVLCIAYILAALRLKSMDGSITRQGEKQRLLPRTTNYSVHILSGAFVGACTLAAFIAGPLIAYVLMFAMLAYLLVLAVYYAVKLM